MKKLLIIWIGLLAMTPVFGQPEQSEEPACNCPSCLAEASGEKLPYTLPGLQELNEDTAVNRGEDQAAQEHEGHDPHAGHDHDDAEGHADPDQETDMHAEPDQDSAHDPHAGHDHSQDPTPAQDPHAGHEHGADDAVGVEVSAEMGKKIGLQIYEAEAGAISKMVVFPAEITLNRDRSAAVSARYASVVQRVSSEVGDAVKKGDVLASLENRETLAAYTVTAPLDGVIVSKDASVGESAAADRVLFEVADLSTVWANISIFPKYQHLVRKGMPVDFIAHDGHTARGVIKFVSPLVSHETRTFTARCELKGADEDFSPGAFVRARIATTSAQVEVRVEREAVQMLEGEAVIFVPAGQGYEPREVVLGMADSHNVEIKSGLNPGERYVAVGAFSLKAQMITSGLDPHAGHGH